MPRATEWRRGAVAYVEDTADFERHQLLCSLAEGETLTRVRFRYQLQHVAQFPADALGIPAAVGITLSGAAAVEPPIFPLTTPDGDWLWWEGSFPLPSNVAYEDGTINELDVWPSDAHERDGRAQRVADVGGSKVWWVAEAPADLAVQDTFYASVSWSVLVLLPAS